MSTNPIRNRCAMMVGLLLLLFTLSAVACAQTTSSPASSPAASAPTAPPGAAPVSGGQTTGPASSAPQTVKIGVILPLTGPSAGIGVDCKDADQLAADIVNNKYDLNMPFANTQGLPNLGGAKVDLVFGDSQTSPTVGQSEAQRLITQEKVVALRGSYNSNVTQTVSDVAEQFGIPMVNGSSSAVALTQRGYKTFFRTGPNDDTFVKNFFDMMDDVQKQNHVSVKTIATVYANAIQGTDMAKAVKQLAQQRGYQLVDDIAFPMGSSDVSSEVQKLKADNPDVVIMLTELPDATLFMRTFKQQGYNPRAILAYGAGFVDPKFFSVMGKDAEDAITKSSWAPDIAAKNPLAKAVEDMFTSKYKQGMTENSARSFTATMTLVDAINRAKSTDPKAIQAALAATDIPGDQLIVPWQGVKFGPDGQNIYASGINMQAIGGQYYTVWPFSAASKQIVWPRPKWSELP